MAAFDVATGVIELVPLCASGFCFICKAHGGVQDQRLKIEVQRRVLKAWAHIWEITLHDADHADPRRYDKFRAWIANHPQLGVEVFRIVSAISDLLADTKSLEKKYGIVLERKDPALRDLDDGDLFQGRNKFRLTTHDLSARKHHMSIVQRCRFRLTGEEKFDRFVAKLRDFMDELWKTFSEAQAKNIERALLQQVAENNDIAVLKQISKVYGEEAAKRRKDGQRHQGYDLMREVAEFKAKVQDLSSMRARDTLKRKLSGMTTHFLQSADTLYPQDFIYNYRNWPFADGKATLAVKHCGCKARYIEWKSYADGEDGRGGHDSEIENNIMELADIFAIKKRPSAFRVLPFEGIFRSKRGLRFGLVFQPPSYIENIDLKNKRLRKVSRPRLPHTLLEHIGNGAGTLPLGDRFGVARKLAGALYAMHTAGWVHKK